MPSFSQTYTSNSSVTIPSYAVAVTITVAGANGGVGGSDAGAPGGSGGSGRVGTFTLSGNVTRTLTFNIGRQGSNGASNQSSAAGGSGGSGVASGGTGGRAGPQGSSGGGGGGGGATGVYDSFTNSWIIVAGGGGGGGGAAFPNVPGIDGGAGSGWGGGSIASITNGGNGGNCPTDGSGGGGGGGGASGGGGGANGFDVGSGNVRAQGGSGGGSGYRSSAVTWTGASSLNSSNGYVTVSYDIPEPSISFSISPSTICNGEISTLSWNVTGAVDTVTIDQGIGSVGTSGTRFVSPSSTTSYTLTASGPGGTASSVVTLTVRQPSSTNLTTDSASIIRGQSTQLRWTTTGDSTSATIIPGIGSVNINGLTTVSPTETTTYEIYVEGICNDVFDSVTLIVYQPPTIELSGPETLNYNQQGTLSYTATYADISLVVTPIYRYKNESVTGNSINLPTGSSVTGTLEDFIPYNDFGPTSVDYIIIATGNGGQDSKQITIPINIDETPDNFLIPESEDLVKDQDPIYTPDQTITSYKIVLDDIDIPVEVKADKPILVDVNEQDSWGQIRRIQ